MNIKTLIKNDILFQNQNLGGKQCPNTQIITQAKVITLLVRTFMQLKPSLRTIKRRLMMLWNGLTRKMSLSSSDA
jgi:hypothetical protein